MNEATKPTNELVALPESMQREASLAVQMSRAEIDMQVATAHAFPRKLSLVVRNILELATMDEATADSLIYALPRGGNSIEGPSIRLAEIVMSQWGNCRAAARVVHVDRFEKYVEAEGVFHDLETNAATTMRVRRSIEDSNGKLFKADMILITGNAACAIAKRNAIIAGVPKVIWSKAYEAAENVLRGDVKTLASRRETVFRAFAAFGILPEQIYAALDIGGVDDVNSDHMITLSAIRAAIKNGDMTPEEAFPKVVAGVKPGEPLANKLDAIVAKREQKSDDKSADAKSKTEEHVEQKTGEITDKPVDGEKGDGATPSEQKPVEDKPKRARKTAEKPVEQAATSEAQTDRSDDDKPASDAVREEDVPFARDETAVVEDKADDATITRFDELLDQGREAASNGVAAFKKWKNPLNQKDYDVIQPELKKLQKLAEDVDAR